MSYSPISTLKPVDDVEDRREVFMSSRDSALIGTSDNTCTWVSFSSLTPVVTTRRTITYEVPVEDNSTKPDNPVNPDSLDTSTHTITYTSGGSTYATTYTPWVCVKRQIVHPYGSPLQGIYREVWQYNVPFYQYKFS